MSGVNLHRIVVERDSDGDPTHVRFVCDGGNDAACHHWPDCDCETWGVWHFADVEDQTLPYSERTPLPGHESVQQKQCWIEPWFNVAIGHEPFEWLDAYDGDTDVDDLPNASEFLQSGPIIPTFCGDYMTWEYDEQVTQ